MKTPAKSSQAGKSKSPAGAGTSGGAAQSQEEIQRKLDMWGELFMDSMDKKKTKKRKLSVASDHEDDMSGGLEANDSAPPPAKKVPIRVVADTGIRLEPQQRPEDWKLFVSSKIMNVNGKVLPRKDGLDQYKDIGVLKREDKHKARQLAEKMNGGADDDEENFFLKADLENAIQEVKDLAATQLKGREKQKYEAQRVVEQGGKKQKSAKVPIAILQGMNAKAKEREAAQRAKEIELGIYVKKKKTGPSLKEKIISNRGRRSGLDNTEGDGSRELKVASMGKFSRGTLFVDTKGIGKRMEEDKAERKIQKGYGGNAFINKGIQKGPKGKKKKAGGGGGKKGGKPKSASTRPGRAGGGKSH